MSRLFGPVRQAAWVTRDLDEALGRFRRRLGIGPWFVARGLAVPNMTHRGRPAAPVLSVALAASGGLQLEIIAQTNDAPSVFAEWLDAHPGETLVQHLAFWVEDYPAALAEARARGLSVVAEARSSMGAFSYLEDPGDPTLLVELTELTGSRRATFGAVEAAACDWDGAEPVREGWPGTTARPIR